MRALLVPFVVAGVVAALSIAACGIELDVAPDDDADASVASSSGRSASSGTAPNTSSSGGVSSSSSGGSSSSGTNDACTPLDAVSACQNVACGPVSDGCGSTVDCSDTCAAPQTCGGGMLSDANACGCTSTTTACPDGKDCGDIRNECGNAVVCGDPNCSGAAQTACVSNVCVCTPNATACDGKACGPANDGCGDIECPDMCVGPSTCGAGGNPNQCGCTPRSKAVACEEATMNPTCDGTVSDECGGSITCDAVCAGTKTCKGCMGGRQCCRE